MGALSEGERGWGWNPNPFLLLIISTVLSKSLAVDGFGVFLIRKQIRMWESSPVLSAS